MGCFFCFNIIQKTFGKSKKIIYLCRRNNGGRMFRDRNPTPVKKRKVL